MFVARRLKYIAACQILHKKFCSEYMLTISEFQIGRQTCILHFKDQKNIERKEKKMYNSRAESSTIPAAKKNMLIQDSGHHFLKSIAIPYAKTCCHGFYKQFPYSTFPH